MTPNTNLLLLHALLLILASPQTDIASLNCPDDFNVTLANVTTGIGNSEIATFFFSPFRSTQQVADVEAFIIQSDQDSYESYIYGTLIWPYVAIAAAFFITYLILIFCMIF